MRLQRVWVCAWLLSLLVGVCAYGTVAKADHTHTDHSDTVFRIGTFDRSSAEFAAESPKHSVNFIIGRSDPAKDWFANQPAALLGQEQQSKQSGRTAPRKIQFTLNQPPASAYRMHVALLIETASVPMIRIGINGKYGMLYLHPRLDYSNGDQGDSFYPAFSHADVEFEFPGSYLKSGMNTITLQAIEDASKAVPEVGLTYDAIELDKGHADFNPNIPALFSFQLSFTSSKAES